MYRYAGQHTSCGWDHVWMVFCDLLSLFSRIICSVDCISISLLVFLLLFCFWFFETGSHYVVQTGLELTILLPQPAKCQDYRYAPQHKALCCSNRLHFTCLSIPHLVGVWVVPSFRLLRVLLVWTTMCKLLCGPVFILPEQIPRSEVTNAWGVARLLAKAAAPFYIPTGVWGFLSHVPASIWCHLSLWLQPPLWELGICLLWFWLAWPQWLMMQGVFLWA
jgi:hypothetical protein